jgi:hypothetical protein
MSRSTSPRCWPNRWAASAFRLARSKAPLWRERRRARHDDRGLPGASTLDIPDRDDQVVFGETRTPPQNWPFHVLPPVPLEPEQVERFGPARNLALAPVGS